MRSFKTFQSSCKNVLACISRAMMIMFVLVSTHMFINAQATLSLQGILKKANGIALEDDTYPITFKIYVVDSTQVKWMETQPEVEVISGIYSVILGKVTPLNLPFDKDYELGISIGSQEMRPRVRLTSAPYALALRGSSNQFPSAGQVLADEVKVAQGVLASGGAPGLNGVDKNGYAFTGNSGDNDSGLFSTADGKASLYSNNTEILSVTPGTATVSGTLNTNNVDVINNGSLKYNGLSDWRLVEVNNFDSDAEGWNVYSPLSGQWIGWNQTTGVAAPRSDLGNFIGNILLPSSNNQVLKKQFNPGTNQWGSFTRIKVRFRYYFIDSWEFGGEEKAWAAFSSNVNGTDLRVGWQTLYQSLSEGNGRFTQGSPTFSSQADFIGLTNYGDNWMDVEMTAKASGSSFWVFIGSTLDDVVANERIGVGGVEIYVR